MTLIDLAIYALVMANVARARISYKIPVPQTEGPEAFLRILRVQVNSAEQLVLHLPLLWIAAFAMDDIFAASLGAVWAFARVLYTRGYYQKPKRRAKGYVISFIINGILLIGGPGQHCCFSLGLK